MILILVLIPSLVILDEKVEDRFEYPAEIDMTEFVSLSASPPPPLNYHLFGVLVFHGRDTHNQMSSFVKQGREGPWLRYDMNGHVAPVSSDREVLEGNYGGDRNRKHVMHLTYIREDSIDAFFAERDSTSPAFYSSCYIYFLAVLVLLTFFLTGWRC